MKKIFENARGLSVRAINGGMLAVLLVFATSSVATADEAYAKSSLKNMSDYLAKQKAYTFEFDSILGVVTANGQGLELASSGELKLHRPNKLYASRKGGFVDLETFYNGKKLSIYGKGANVYTEVETSGSIDDLITTLIVEYGMPLPAADLLATNAYDALLEGVVDIQDLGSGVIEGIECDYFAFRKKDVDIQIWVAQGDKPFPCRFVITSKDIKGQPQYSVQLRDWKTHRSLNSWNFVYSNKTAAEKVDISELQGSMLPENFSTGGK